eukprot:2883978-Amphidinium_carterae.1
MVISKLNQHWASVHCPWCSVPSDIIKDDSACNTCAQDLAHVLPHLHRHPYGWNPSCTSLQCVATSHHNIYSRKVNRVFEEKWAMSQGSKTCLIGERCVLACIGCLYL